MKSLLTKINKYREEKRKGLVLLMDPDKLQGYYLEERVKFAKEFADFIFLGGSLTHESLDGEMIDFIKEKTGKPVIIFPANSMHVHPNADAILYLSLLSGRNPEYLIGQQVTATPFVKKSGLEVLPTSYLLIGTGKPTTAEYITQTFPIPANKADIAATTALAGEYMGKKITYLDAGSGADNHVPGKLISAVRKNTSLPLIVGGGIRNSDSAELVLESGADMIVIGNLMEEDPESGIDIGLMIKGSSLSQ